MDFHHFTLKSKEGWQTGSFTFYTHAIAGDIVLNNSSSNWVTAPIQDTPQLIVGANGEILIQGNVRITGDLIVEGRADQNQRART